MKKIRKILSLVLTLAIFATTMLMFSTTTSALKIGDSWKLGAPNASTAPNNGQFTIGMAHRTEAEVFDNTNYENYLSMEKYGADITMAGYKQAKLVGAGHVWSAGETAYFVGDKIPMPIDPTNRGTLVFAHRANDDTYHFYASVGRAPVISFTAPVNGTYTYEVYVSFFNNIGVFTSKGNEPLKLTHDSVSAGGGDPNNAVDRHDPQANSHGIYVYYKCTATVTLKKGETFNIAFCKLDGNSVASLVAQGKSDFKDTAYDVKASFKSVSFTLSDAQTSDLNDTTTTPTTPPPQTTPEGTTPEQSTTEPIVTPPESSNNSSDNTSSTTPNVTTDPVDTESDENKSTVVSYDNMKGGIIAAIVLSILNLLVSAAIIVLMVLKKK